jgi:cysteine desulfurase
MVLPVYLDYNATTPVAPEVADAIEPYLREHFGNPSSSHAYGRRAHDAVDRAREQAAALVGATPGEIVFTGCATEANNLAIFGVTRALRGAKRHVVTSAAEHPAVLQPCLRLREDGWDVTIVEVDQHGRVDPQAVARALRDDTALVSIMLANNEVGTIQPIAEIAALARSRGAIVHTDAAQAAGKIPVNVGKLGVDLLTLAGHKFYATKGIGALYVRNGTPLAPVLVGADHERGLRPGTENVPAVLAAGVPGLELNGHPEHRLPNTLNVSFPRASGRELLRAAETDVAASLGAACHAESDSVSGVLAAMSIGYERAAGAVRLSVGAPTTEEEVRHAGRALVKAWWAVRRA